MKTSRILAAVIATLLPFAASAATHSWTGGGANNNVSNALNWTGGAPSSSLSSTTLVFPGVGDPFPIFDTAGFQFVGVQFTGGAAAHSFSGNAVTVGTDGIVNLSTNNQTFTNQVNIATTSFTGGIRAISGPLTFTGLVDLGTNALSVTDDGNTSFRNFGGIGSVTKGGAGTMTWAPTATTSADIIVSAGTLTTVADGSTDGFSGSASIAVNGTSALNIGEHMTLDGGAQLTRAAGASVALAAGKILTVQAGSDVLITGNFSSPNPNSAINVIGSGSTLQTLAGGRLEIADTLRVQSGANVTASGGLDAGFGSGPAAFILVDGSGTSFSAGGVSQLSTATFDVSNSATANFGALTAVGGITRSISVTSGGDVSLGGSLQFEGASLDTATLTVHGAGSTWTQTGASAVTFGASGEDAVVNLQDGGVFTSGTGGVTLNVTATINIDGGTLDLRGALVRNGGVLNFNSGSLKTVDNFTVGGGGLLGTSLTLDATRSFTTSGITTVDSSRILTLNGGTFTTAALVNHGTVSVTGAGGLNIGTAPVTGGLNVGNGAFGSSVTLGAGANLAVTNTTAVASGALLRLNGGSFAGGSIVNDGTIDHQDGALGFTGTLTNTAAGRLFVGGLSSAPGQIDNAGRITLQNGLGFLGGVGALVNTGLITGDGTIAKPLTNSASGQLRAELGKTLSFTGTVAPNAGTFSLQGGTLEFSTAITNGATGFIAGRGALRTAGLANLGVMAFSGGTADVYGDVSNGSGGRIGTSGAGSVTTFFDDVIHNGLEIFTGASASTVFFGGQSGAGSFTGTGTVYFNGDLRPGNSPAGVLYEGDLVFGGASSLTLEIGGLVAGTQYDHLDVAGTLHADGLLKVALLDDFTPAAGDTFDFFDAGTMAGAFDAIELPALAAGLSWDTSKIASTGAVAVVPEPGSGMLLAGGLAWLGWRRRCGRIRGAHASRGLVAASRRNELPSASESESASAFRTVSEVRAGGTPSPALGTSALPGNRPLRKTSRCHPAHVI